METMSGNNLHKIDRSHRRLRRRQDLSKQPYMTACEKDYLNGTLFEATIGVDSTGWYDYYFEFSDGVEIVTTDLDSVYVEISTYVPGDADGSGEVDIDDVVYLLQYIFGGGPAPDPLESGDADCSGEVDIDDVVYLIEYIFASGPPPC